MKIGRFAVEFFRFLFDVRKLVFGILLMSLAASGAFAVDDVKSLSGEARQQLKQADKLIRKGEFTQAEEIYRDVLKRFPENSDARLKLANVLIKQKIVVEAYQLAFDVAKAEPKNSFAYALIGTALLTTGNFAEASRMLQISLQLNDREALAWAGVGLLDFYENRIDMSIENLRAAVYLDDNDPDFIFALAQVSARAEKYKEAAEAYRRFLEVAPISDTERRDRIKGLINFLRFLGGKRSLYSVDGAERTAVSFELVRDRPVITVRINKDQRPFRFVLDTGSGISVISDETAKLLKIKPVTRGGLARAIGGAGKFQIVYGFLKSVHVGDVEVESVPVYIREFHSNDEKIDGYIGLSLISKFLTTIDYGEKTFALVRKDVAEKQNVNAEPELFLPLRLTSSGFLSGEVQLEGIEDPLNFIVDTGASISVISHEVANSSGISRFEREQKMRVIGAAGVTENVSTFLLPRLTFGKNTRESVTAVALDLNIINEASGFRQAGILGGNFLKNYRLTFDFEKSKVIFTPLMK